jgi:hypothetical protein
MPRVARMPPATRFFARLDRFECECPNCGLIISPLSNKHREPQRLATPSNKRVAARDRPGRSIRDLVWNPYSHRLRCPHCRHVYLAGLVLWPVLPRHPYQEAPEDTVPDPRQQLELRGEARGWWANQVKRETEAVNLAIEHPCTCPERGTSRTCEIHGWPELRGTT